MRSNNVVFVTAKFVQTSIYLMNLKLSLHLISSDTRPLYETLVRSKASFLYFLWHALYIRIQRRLSGRLSIPMFIGTPCTITERSLMQFKFYTSAGSVINLVTSQNHQLAHSPSQYWINIKYHFQYFLLRQFS